MDYYSYEDILYDAARLQKEYFGLIECETIGYSVQKRKIVMLMLGCGYKKIFLTAGIHGRESINPRILMKFAEYYAETYYETAEFYNYSFCIIPLLNPDGYVKALTEPSMAEYKFNQNGVDINRNFPSAHYRSGGVCGEYAASEPETRALIMAFKSHPSVMYIDFHSRGECIYYYRKALGDGYNKKQLAIAKKIAEGSGYVIKDPAEEIEDGDSGGNSVHYYSETFKMPAFTIETAPDNASFPMDMSLADEAFDKLKDLLYKTAVIDKKDICPYNQ